jgi:predicted kinase
MMSGLPASGKTTTAMRLHAELGGLLIRSCDIYQELGIVLSQWVERTRRFTVDVAAYSRARDDAYNLIANRVDATIEMGLPLVIVDAVHGERDKRRRLYDICHVRRATPVIVLCSCDNFEEVRRRFRTRQGRECEPQHEASDLSVFHDIARRWQSPADDVLLDGTRPTMLTYDTLAGRVAVDHTDLPEMAQRIRLVLGSRVSTPARG